MTTRAEAIYGIDGRIPFGVLAWQVLSLSAAILWVALEEAGCKPRWAWRNPESGKLCAATTTKDGHVVNPLLLMLAEAGDGLEIQENVASPHGLFFVVLEYAGAVRIVARFGAHARISVAVSPGTDAYVLGKKLTSLLDRFTERLVRQ